MCGATDIVLVDSPPDSVHPDKEEDDQLARSNKKKKINGGSGEGSSENFGSICERDESSRKISYKDMVLDECMSTPPELLLPPSDRADDEEFSDDDLDDGDEDDHECPTIKISKEEKRRLRSRWKNALIIKLIDHTVGYTYLVRRLKSLWQIKFHIDVIDVGFGAYVIKSENEDEREHALYGGPWIITDHYLAVTNWFHNFDPETYTVFKLAVWVRFPNMSMEYYDPIWLLGIGRRIGTPSMLMCLLPGLLEDDTLACMLRLTCQNRCSLNLD